MSSILTSGCGITFLRQDRASWTKVLRVCGIDIIDAGGPAVSNEYILNKTIDTLCIWDQQIDHVVCQLTSLGKLEIDVSGTEYKHRQRLLQTDSMRNFTWEGLWPSSVSKSSNIKKDYYKWCYSERLELQNIIVKLTLLDMLCRDKQIPLTVLQGYFIPWKNVRSESYMNMLDKINFDRDFVIYDYYKNNESYALHDFTNGNNLPNKQFAVHFAKKMNSEILHFDIEHKLNKFNE